MMRASSNGVMTWTYVLFRMTRTLSVFSLWTASSFLTNVPSTAFRRVSPSIGYGSASLYRELLQPRPMTKNSTQEAEPQTIAFGMEDQGFLACDLCAILIASQLMGLLDVLNDPEFSRHGGWLQRIPAVPMTLNALVEKVVFLSLFWFPLSIIRLPSVFLSDSTDEESSGIMDLGEVFSTVVLFSVARVGAAVVISNFSAVDFHIFDVLRDCYVVGLAMLSFRFLYSQYVR